MKYFKQNCKRLYRYWDTDENRMYYKKDCGNNGGTLMATAVGFPDSIILMEGVDVDGVEYFEGDLYKNKYEIIYILEADRFGQLWFVGIPLGKESRSHYGQVPMNYRSDLKKIGNAFENTEHLKNE